jgi:lysophospholipase L1-like esterase
MSWEIFREEVLKVVSKPENIKNVDLVATTYAVQYDACIKRGGDLVNRIPLVKGDIDSMKAIFVRALTNGLNAKEKYDLTGEMGKGVIKYWTGAIMSTIIPPLVTLEQVSTGATANIFVNSNVVLNPGIWKSSKSTNTPQEKNTSNKKNENTNAKPLDSNTKESLLFVGDSVTAGSISYPLVIKPQLLNLNIDVLAKGGMTTKWMLDNLPNQLSARQYNRVYIYGGINDAFNDSISIKTSISNVQKMVDLITNAGAKAVVIIGYNMDTSTDYRKIPTTKYVSDVAKYIPMIEKYKKYQSSLLTDIKNAEFIGKFEIGPLSDGLHPSKSQHKIIANIIKNAL